MKKMLLSAVVITLASSVALAKGECAFKTAREACPGKETEAFKPYEGKKETDDKKEVEDEKACLALAEKGAKIVRKGTLTSKKVHTVTFAGKDLAKTFEDKKECK
jgi:hypothetical protein